MLTLYSYTNHTIRKLLSNAALGLLLVLCSLTNTNAQDSIAVISGAVLEDLLENNDEQSYDFYSLYDELQTLLDAPLNINKADYEDLKSLQLLTDIQIADILDHREKYGNYLSIYELQSVPSLDIGTCNAFIPFVSVGNTTAPTSLKNIIANAEHSLVGKYKRILQEKKGYTDEASSPYLGNEDYYYLRYNVTSGRNIRGGLTMEKDAGEEFFTGSNRKGFDYYSGFLYLKDMHPLFEYISLGDYTISMGQGLILHNSFGSNKSGYVMNVKRGGSVIKPYSSVNEFNLFRGAATTLNISDNIDLTIFGSHKNIDGNRITADTLENTSFDGISSFVINGLHRTENEISKRGTVSQTTYGGVLKFQPMRRLHLGANFLSNSFSVPFSPSNRPYRKFAFTGDQLSNTSIDYSYRYENFNFFGEVSRSSNGGYAQIHGLLATLGRNMDASLIYRNYEKEYQVLNGNAFGETAMPTNEKGIYLALQFKPWRSITVSSYVDLWKHPWLRNRIDAPSDGREFLAKVEYNKKRKFNLYVQYRFEEKGENSDFSRTGTKLVVDKAQHRARLNFTYTYSTELSLISRVEYNHFSKETQNSQGYLLFQDVKYKPIGKPYSFAMRYAVFDTDDFDSRIYMYENDVLYEFSIPFYSNSGTRFYIKGQYKLTPRFYIQLRYARTYIDNIEDILLPDGSYVPLTIGSGNEATTGNVRSDFKAVFKYTIK